MVFLKRGFFWGKPVWPGAGWFFYLSFTGAVPAQSQHIMVSGPSPHLVKVVRDIHRQGGNIIDGAVAGAFSLSVTHPYFVSLGCGGFAVFRYKGETQSLDFREVAPRAVTENFYTQHRLSSTEGGQASGVPGFVAGMWELHQKYGSLSWKQVVRPARILARKGFEVSGDFFHRTQKAKNHFNKAGLQTFFHSRGQQPFKPSEVFKQTLMAKALKQISQKGRKVFYQGDIGQDVVQTVLNHQGQMSLKDLQDYRVRWLKPLTFQWAGFTFYSQPLPSSGGIILARSIQLLQLHQHHLSPSTRFGLNEWHLLAEVLKAAFRPRSQMGDMDPQTQAPWLKEWLSPQKLLQAGKTISLSSVLKSPPPREVLNKPPKKESPQTTHFSLINNKGEAVAMTLTLNGDFGSKVVTKKYGIVLNNQMDDFNTHPQKPNQFGLIQGKNNSPRPGKRPLSSMSPTLVTQGGKVVMALGASGGPRIISSVFQVIYRHLIQGLDLDLAVQAPRLHHQFLPRTLFLEENRFTPSTRLALRSRGHKLKTVPSLAKVYGVSRSKKTGFLQGSYDSRGEGAAGGH